MRKYIVSATRQRFLNYCREVGLSPDREAIYVYSAHQLRGIRWEQVVVEDDWFDGRSSANIHELLAEMRYLKALA